jgi:hypothetical protein
MPEPAKHATHFLPVERASEAEIHRQSSHFLELSFLSKLLNAVPDLILFLNMERQIIFANQSFLTFFEIQDVPSIYGLRPGKVMKCAHSGEDEGCGTTEFCKVCGAAKAIQYCQQGKECCEECHIIRIENKGHLDLRVWTTPFKEGDEKFIIFVVANIGHEKRRMVLERIFFHDVLNTASVVNGFAKRLKKAKPEDAEKFKEKVSFASDMLVEEIVAHRDLTMAENAELSVNFESTNSLEILKKIIDLYQEHDAVKGRHIFLDTHSSSIDFITDQSLFKRVIGNMVKNALEGSKEGENITIGCQVKEDCIEFQVRNPNFMPREVQLQIFQRSFSTKGENRGLGTYSMKLLSERFLNGRVSFITSEKNGTTFNACYPLK